MAISELGVDPVDLALSADHMDMRGTDLRESHAAAHAAIEGAAIGWVGTSAVILQARLRDFQAVTEDLCGQITTMGQQFRAASRGYDQTDENSAVALGSEMRPEAPQAAD